MIGGEDVTTGDDQAGDRAARQGARARGRPPGRRGRGRARDLCRGRGLGGLAPDAVGRARRRVPARGRPALRAMARHARRRDDARPVEDVASGGDRRRRGADRLLALERRVHAPHLRGAARLVAGRLEPHGVPAARGLRLRRHALQLHRDRGQPPGEHGADGQHGRLEAGDDGDVLGVLADAPAAGGRAAAGRDQPRLRLGCRDRRRRARLRAPRRDPLHRLDGGLQLDVADDRLEHREGPLPQLPAHRRRDRRQGLHRRAPVRERRRARNRDPPRLVRVPGTEVQRGVARLRAVEPLARAPRDDWKKRWPSSRWATSPTSRTSWAR